MKKNRRFLMLGLTLACVLAVLCATLTTSAPRFSEKTTKVLHSGEDAGELVLRFYDQTPHIPYLGIKAYSEYVKQQPLKLLEQEKGTWTLENGIGEQLLCDPKAGTIFVEHWNRFFDLPLPLEEKALGWKDTATRFIRITDVDYEGEAEPVTLDFSKYGIQLYADENDIYLPVSTLSNMMTDIATNYLTYNGEALYLVRAGENNIEPNVDVFESEVLKAELQGQKRPEDVVKQCYADLCFNLDYFFGHPGKAALDEAITEKGLDQALTDLGDEGARLKAELLSPDLTEYLCATIKLFSRYLSDGHTLCTGAMYFLGVPYVQENAAAFENLMEAYCLYLLRNPEIRQQLLNQSIPEQRSLCWGDETYHESGSTAIIRLDDFIPDEAAWEAYYNGEGQLPDDCLGIVVKGLRKASENLEIKHVILDLSCNSGGSPDVMMSILAMTTGQTQLYGIQKLTGQRMTFTFEADANFDGVFDEKDREVRYDFDYGGLTTRHASSCGNLFPIIMQEAGAVVLGEPTSGGSCCVQIGTDAEGFSYMMSSYQWQLTDSQGNDVEGGCSVDLPMEPQSDEILNSIVKRFSIGNEVPLFQTYYDAERLDKMMTEYFESQSEAKLAS
jgi:hypothetical protein